MKKKHVNPDNNRHPYMQPKNWINGTLCYWRNNSMYDEKTKQKFEKWVKDMAKDQTLSPSKLMDKPV